MTPRPPIALLRDDDSQLVAQSLAGSREAFSQLVARYQAVVCAVTYSATGDLAQSEDLAQETFVAAWSSLAELRDPRFLRGWLCGIARNVSHGARRRQQSDPTVGSAAIDEAHEVPANEPLPLEHAISREEEGILWRTLEAIPELYREPLILFYREHQSIAHVAEALDLSEDLVKQRLMRGRRALAEQVLAFVEGTLARSTPGPRFALEVVGALPPLLGTASVGGASAATVKGALTSKLVTAGPIASGLLGAATSAFGAWASLGLGLAAARTPRERAFTVRGWKTGVLGSLAFSGLIVLLSSWPRFWLSHVEVLGGIAATLLLAFPAWLCSFCARLLRDTRRLREEALQNEPGLFGAARPTLERKSRHHLLGLPLWHVRLETQRPGTPPVFAWIAVGDVAFGRLFALGSFAVAPVSLGAVSVGLFTVGVVSAGLVPVGAVALGGLAVGTLTAGLAAAGVISFGWKAATGAIAFADQYALGRLAIADHPNDEAARQFFEQHHADARFDTLLIAMAVLIVVPMLSARLFTWRSRAR